MVMSAARTKRRLWFYGREDTTDGDGTIATDDSLAMARLPIAGRVDPTQSHRHANRDDSSTIRRTLSDWPVALYVPNLLGYLRILLSFHGMKHSIELHFNKALNTWIAASVLDLIDGIAARKLNQCSQFGILLDIIADNILRTVVWISCVILVISNRHDDGSSSSGGSSVSVICAWTIIICLEWITMFCSQCDQASRKGEVQIGRHWKDVKRKGNETMSHPPFWVQAVFNNNFRSPSGILAIYGLFVAPLGSYVWNASNVSTTNNETTWPTKLFSEQVIMILIATSYVGRTLSAAVELWLCWRYLSNIIARDSYGRKRKS